MPPSDGPTTARRRGMPSACTASCAAARDVLDRQHRERQAVALGPCADRSTPARWSRGSCRASSRRSRGSARCRWPGRGRPSPPTSRASGLGRRAAWRPARARSRAAARCRARVQRAPGLVGDRRAHQRTAPVHRKLTRDNDSLARLGHASPREPDKTGSLRDLRCRPLLTSGYELMAAAARLTPSRSPLRQSLDFVQPRPARTGADQIGEAAQRRPLRRRLRHVARPAHVHRREQVYGRELLAQHVRTVRLQMIVHDRPRCLDLHSQGFAYGRRVLGRAEYPADRTTAGTARQARSPETPTTGTTRRAARFPVVARARRPGDARQVPSRAPPTRSMGGRRSRASVLAPAGSAAGTPGCAARSYRNRPARDCVERRARSA